MTGCNDLLSLPLLPPRLSLSFVLLPQPSNRGEKCPLLLCGIIISFLPSDFPYSFPLIPFPFIHFHSHFLPSQVLPFHLPFLANLTIIMSFPPISKLCHTSSPLLPTLTQAYINPTKPRLIVYPGFLSSRLFQYDFGPCKLLIQFVLCYATWSRRIPT